MKTVDWVVPLVLVLAVAGVLVYAEVNPDFKAKLADGCMVAVDPPPECAPMETGLPMAWSVGISVGVAVALAGLLVSAWWIARRSSRTDVASSLGPGERRAAPDAASRPVGDAPPCASCQSAPSEGGLFCAPCRSLWTSVAAEERA